MPNHAKDEMPKALIVSFDFPPSNRVAVQRSLAYAWHLKQLGWKLKVLTVSENGYEGIVDHSLFYPAELKDDVIRVPVIDSKKIGFRGKYFDFFAIPDEWISWLFLGIPKGYSIIKSFRPDVIFSTCPPYTTHLLAGVLAKLGRLPWVADYRDPFVGAQVQSSVKGRVWAMGAVDKFTAKNASKLVFATEESCALYRKRYPEFEYEKFTTIENGYYDLPDIKRDKSDSLTSKKDRFELLYSGSIYGNRDPSIIFSVLKELLSKGQIGSRDFVLKFQGFGYGDYLNELVEKFGITEIVEFVDPVGFEQSIIAMRNANALLLVQGPVFDLQIPAKAYEYIASSSPVIGLVGRQGATANLLAPIPNASVIETKEETLTALINLLSEDSHHQEYDISKYSRFEKTKQLSSVLMAVVKGSK